MALAGVAHISDARCRQCRVARGSAYDVGGLFGHFVEQAVGVRGVEFGDELVPAAHRLERNGCSEESKRRAHARADRNDDARDAELVRKSCGMERRRAAERDHGVVLDGLAEFHCMHARGIRHVLGDDFCDCERAERGVYFERLRDVAGYGNFRTGGFKRDAAAGKALRVEEAHRAVRIGHRCMHAAARVARRAGLGTCAVGADLHALEIVDSRNRAAARADLHHLDDGDADRQPAAFHEPVHAAEFETARDLGFEIVDKADLGGGAAHVERQCAVRAAALGHGAREDGAAGRARFDEPHRLRRAHRQRAQRAAGSHEIHGTDYAHRLQARLQPVQITGHHRLHICIGAGGGDAFVLADFRTHVRRQRDPQVRQRAFEYFLHALFMRGIREALQKRDGNAFDAVLFQCRHQGFDGSFVERQQDATFGVYALRHRQAQMARHQRRRLVQKNIILREAVLPADFHEIAETFGSDERGLRALALDQRVGRQRGAEDEDVQRAGFEPGLREDLGDGGDHGFFRRARRGEHLAGPALAARLENDVRESPADIDGETRAC